MKKYILVLVLLLGVCTMVLYNYCSNNRTVIVDEKRVLSYSSGISMMLETGASTGMYEVSSDTSWPDSSEYIFNESLSKCENGSSITWDSDNFAVVVSGNVSDRCYIYFDYYNLVTFYIETLNTTYTYYTTEGTTWSEWIETDYNTESLYISNDYIKLDGYDYLQNNINSCKYVSISDEIVADRVYAFRTGSIIETSLSSSYYCYNYTENKIDTNQSGSLTIALKDSDGFSVSGGAITIYEVLSLEENDGAVVLSYNDKGADKWVNWGGTIDLDDSSLAQSLASYAEANDVSLTGCTVPIGSSGIVTFSNIDSGLYLVVQTIDSDNFEIIDPFLLLIPSIENDSFTYDFETTITVIAIEPVEEEENPDTTFE